MKTLQEHMLVIKGKISQEEYSNFEQMKVSEQLLYKGCDLKVEVASGFSLDLTDD